MGPLRELLAVDERRTLEFFVTGLQDVCDGGVDRQELLYNASVLAHYALVSTQSATVPGSLSCRSAVGRGSPISPVAPPTRTTG